MALGNHVVRLGNGIIAIARTRAWRNWLVDVVCVHVLVGVGAC